MLSMVEKSIAQAVFVIGYARDAIVRTKQFDIEKAMAPLAIGQSTNTNLPDDYDPSAPRVILGQVEGKISAHFSQVAAQLNIDIDNTNGKTPKEIRDSVSKRINLFQRCVDKMIPRKHQLEHGLVISIQYLIDQTKYPDEVIFDYIQSRFMRVDPLGKAASAGFNVGYKTDDNYFITLSVALYKIAGPMPVNQWSDIRAFPTIGSGIELKVDVNSRPLVDMGNQSADVTTVVLGKSFDFVINDADKFIGAIK